MSFAIKAGKIKMREYFMEFIGALFLVLAIELTGNPLAIGIMLMAMVYIGGHVSGAHYNPAVTLAVWMRGKIKANKILGYMAAQVIGAFAAACIFYFLSGKAFLPSPSKGVPILHSILAEALFTFVLCSVILAVATSRKLEGNRIYGLAIGLTLAACAYAGGGISGGVYNPAVALGPMILKSFLGVQNWSNIAIYLTGPLAGAIFAALVFRYLNPND